MLKGLSGLHQFPIGSEAPGTCLRKRLLVNLVPQSPNSAAEEGVVHSEI